MAAQRSPDISVIIGLSTTQIPEDLDPFDILIYFVTAIGLSSSGSSTVHIYTQTIHRRKQITTNVEDSGPCPVFASFTLAFALQLRKKHRKTSVRVRKTSVRLRKTSIRVQYTYYQNPHTL